MLIKTIWNIGGEYEKRYWYIDDLQAINYVILMNNKFTYFGQNVPLNVIFFLHAV